MKIIICIIGIMLLILDVFSISLIDLEMSKKIFIALLLTVAVIVLIFFDSLYITIVLFFATSFLIRKEIEKKLKEELDKSENWDEDKL